MKVKVAKWGNSLGVRLPKSAVDVVGVRAGTELELTVEGRDFRLRSMVKTSAQLLEELLDHPASAQYPAVQQAIRAISSGCRYGTIKTVVPSRMLPVMPASQASVVNGS